MTPLVYGSEHKFPNINTKKLVTASFGMSKQDKPGGAQAVHINGDVDLHRMTHDKARLLNKIGPAHAIPHLPIAKLQKEHGLDYNVVQETFGAAQFRGDKSVIDVNDVVDFFHLAQDFDKLGTFTQRVENPHKVAVCPALRNGKTGGMISADGREISEEELDLITEMIQKFAFDYFVLEMATTNLGVKVTDLQTILLPAAFEMVGDLIKLKAK